MNIIDAVKSGKKFKRKDETEFLDKEDHIFGEFYQLEEEDLLSDDYEIEAEKIELSWNEIVRSIDKYITSSGYKKTDMREDLGFKE